jgi:hypothetical protein
VILINPLLNLIANHVNRLVFGLGYDPNNLIREYSIGISNIVDLQRLEEVSLGLIQETIGTKSGWIFLIDEVEKNGSKLFRLEPIRSNESSGTVREIFKR